MTTSTLESRFQSLSTQRVFVTGITGFTGTWAAIWLQKIGCEVHGFGLNPDTEPNLYGLSGMDSRVNTTIGDIRDYEQLSSAIEAFQPDLILHLAAQPLVRRSYVSPRETFDVNTQGTVNVLEAARNSPSVKGVVCITTDKVYKNNESGHAFIESDELGGTDPYSASKAAAELAIASFRLSFPGAANGNPYIAVARGGNIIGGGDWAADRIVPDFVRSLVSGSTLTVRNPSSTRPWQHVLALVEGYVLLLAGLASSEPEKYARAWNFGPSLEESLPVGVVIEELSNAWARPSIEIVPSEIHEAGLLAVNSSAAASILGWRSKWSVRESIQKTSSWYREFYQSENSSFELCESQLSEWLEAP